jgi:hypothetical protein
VGQQDAPERRRSPGDEGDDQAGADELLEPTNSWRSGGQSSARKAPRLPSAKLATTSTP